jgi:hypothetical protein
VTIKGTMAVIAIDLTRKVLAIETRQQRCENSIKTAQLGILHVHFKWPLLSKRKS